MTGYEFCTGYWWIFPLAMLFLCFLFMKRGCSRWKCCWHNYQEEEAALEILNRRFARGDIDNSEYEEKKEKILTMTETE